MDDCVKCPLCASKLESSRFREYSSLVDKNYSFVIRKCVLYNHLFSIQTDVATKKIDYLKFSVGNDFKNFVEINYAKNSSRITSYDSAGSPHHIDVDKILELDFNKLSSFEEKINIYLSFS